MKFCAPTCAGSSASNENAESKSKPSADLSPTLHAIDECYRRHVTDVNSAHSSLDKSIAQADLVGEVEIVGRVGGGLVNLLDIDALGGRVALLEHEAHRLLQRNRVRFEAVVERGSGSSIPLGQWLLARIACVGCRNWKQPRCQYRSTHTMGIGRHS